MHSEFTNSFRKALEADGIELVDFTLGLSIELAKKEDIEVDAERTAANIACAVWNKFLRRKLLECVENETVNAIFFAEDFLNARRKFVTNRWRLTLRRHSTTAKS